MLMRIVRQRTIRRKSPSSEEGFLKENKIRLVIKNCKPEIIALACESEKSLLITHTNKFNTGSD